MKKLIVVFFLSISFVSVISCKHNPVSQPPSSKDSTGCCSDICIIPKDYLVTPVGDVFRSDIKIDIFKVDPNPDGSFKLYVHIINAGDDNAHDSKLVVLLPINVSGIRILETDDSTRKYNQCGGRIEFCLGSLDQGSIPGLSNTRHVTIQTSATQPPELPAIESFAAFVYSSTPDPCPYNNFSAWVNDKSLCAFDTVKQIQKGF